MEKAIEDINPRDIIGFWIYLLTDCILFATLFATFIVFNSAVNQHPFGPLLAQHIDLNYVLIETFALLFSNFTFGLAMLAFNKKQVSKAIARLVMTFVLGAIFVGMELHEFIELANNGFRWDSVAAASSFFTLVGTHGLHVSFGLLWIAVIIFQLMRFNYCAIMHQRLICLGLFWNFLDIIWIFVFSIVYLLGAL